jgi:hypothetical protein
MMKRRTLIFAILSAVITLYGCTPETVPLKGNYPTSQIELHSAKSPDSIWVSITELLTRNGLRVKSIDRNRGLIVSRKTSFIRVYTLEDVNGQLQNQEAWVVLPRTVANEKEWKPKTIYGKWSVHITEMENGTTKTKVDPVVVCTFYPNMFTSVEVRGRSTGKLEALIKHLIEE